MAERRKISRARPEGEVQVTIGGNRPARVLDITPQGAHLELASALNPRAECRIALPLPDGVVRLKARVVYCKLTGVPTPGSIGHLVYQAGVEFLDIDPRLEASIRFAYPPVITKPLRRGPIKVKVNVDALAQAAGEGEHGPN
jgi:hypothetical protein